MESNRPFAKRGHREDRQRKRLQQRTRVSIAHLNGIERESEERQRRERTGEKNPEVELEWLTRCRHKSPLRRSPLLLLRLGGLRSLADAQSRRDQPQPTQQEKRRCGKERRKKRRKRQCFFIFFKPKLFCVPFSLFFALSLL